MTRTRQHNTIDTFMARSKILPTYIRLDQEDIAILDRALDAATQLSTIGSDLDWFFVCWQLGQRHKLEPEEVLGPTAFGLSDLFDTSSCYMFSAHIGFNLCCTDPAYSLFWDGRRSYSWSKLEGVLHEYT
jgi:hypothetical protein